MQIADIKYGKYIYSKVHKILKGNNKALDEAQPMIVVDIGVCNIENSVYSLC